MINKAQHILKSVFGFETFRPLQEEVINHILRKNDALVIMPTGGGKSLCYQIPAMIFDGLTIVVSPLISLMKDQVEQLKGFDIPAIFLNSTLTPEEYRQNIELLNRGEIDMLYLAPETLLMPRTLNLLKKLNVNCFTIDEAHCISEWGHDFRPEYRQLAEVRKHFPGAITVALTATATPRVQNDIKQTLELKETETFIASFNRKNLFLEIREKQNPLDQVVHFLKNHQGESGIIYCFSRKQVDDLHLILSREGFSTRPYHAGLSEHERNRNQDAFIRDDVDIIVATIAFGMGIDKPDVRFVVHHDLPQNIESYYQQIGRAGRDGLQADCLMLFSYSDIGKIRYFINQKSESEQQVARRHLNALLNFVEHDQCRRIPLMDYFGEVYPSDECDMCDNCVQDPKEVEDLTVPTQKFLSCVVRTGQLFGTGHISDVLRGSESQKVRKHGHQSLPTHGIGRDLSKKQWSKLSRLLVRQGYLKRGNEYGSLKLEPSGVAVLKGEESVYGILGLKKRSHRNQSNTSKPIDDLDYDRNLFELLRDKRKQLADSAEVPPYIIFPDTTLIEMAYYYPQSDQSLKQIHGIGTAKLKKYGPEFLQLIREFCEENGFEERRKIKSGSLNRPHGKKSTSIRRHHRVGKAYNQGQSISSLMEEYDVKLNTILKHLETYRKEGNELRPDGFPEASILQEKEFEQAKNAFEKIGTELLRPVHDALDGTVSYEELKLVRLYQLSSKMQDQM